MKIGMAHVTPVHKKILVGRFLGKFRFTHIPMNAHQIGRCFDRQQLLLEAFFKGFAKCIFNSYLHVRNRQVKNFLIAIKKGKFNLSIYQCYAIKLLKQMRFFNIITFKKASPRGNIEKQIFNKKSGAFFALNGFLSKNPRTSNLNHHAQLILLATRTHFDLSYRGN